MPVEVKLKDIVDALEEASDSIEHYLDKRTGQVEIVTEDITAEMDLEDDALVDEMPDEFVAKAQEILSDEDENFIKLPDKFDMDDYSIMEDFSRHYPQSRVSLTLMDAIKGKGAFRRFNNLIHDLNIEKKWYEFRQEAYEQIAINWLEANGIPYTRGDEIEADAEM